MTGWPQMSLALGTGQKMPSDFGYCATSGQKDCRDHVCLFILIYLCVYIFLSIFLMYVLALDSKQVRKLFS